MAMIETHRAMVNALGLEDVFTLEYGNGGYLMDARLAAAIETDERAVALFDECPRESTVGDAVQAMCTAHMTLVLALDNAGEEAGDLESQVVHAMKTVYYG